MILFLTTLACAPDLRGDDNTAGSSDPASDTDTSATDTGGTSRVVSVPEGSTGTTYVDVDATADDQWVYFDFGSPTEVTSADTWALAFQRYEVMTDGGTSGSGGIEVAAVEGAALEAVSSAPTDGWGSDDGDTYALGDWYDYDDATHVLTAHPRVYVLRDGTGATWALQFVDYYDDAGNSGHPSFRWKAL